MTRPANPQVSVLIRTKNEEQHLYEVLNMVTAQTLSNHDVIVVDSGSTDSTLDIARAFPVRLVQMPPDQFTYGRALNLGMRHAQADLVAILSAHAIPATNDWLGKMAENFADPDVGGVYGRQLPLPECHPLEARKLYQVYHNRREVQTEVHFFSNSNSMIRRALWLELPFDETLTASEDYLWAREVQRKGYAIVYEPQAPVHHSHNETYRQMFQRTANLSHAMGLIEPKHPRTATWRLFFGLTAGTVLDLAYVLHKRMYQGGDLSYAVQRRFWLEWGRYQGTRAARAATKTASFSGQPG